MPRQPKTTIEASRALVERARQAAKEIAVETAAGGISTAVETQAEAISTAGRKAALGAPKEQIAARLGVATMALVRAEQHVSAVDQFPHLRAAPQGKAIATAKRLRAAGPSSVEGMPERPEFWAHRRKTVDPSKRAYQALRQLNLKMALITKTPPQQVFDSMDPFEGGMEVAFASDAVAIAEAFVPWLQEYVSILRRRCAEAGHPVRAAVPDVPKPQPALRRVK